MSLSLPPHPFFSHSLQTFTPLTIHSQRSAICHPLIGYLTHSTSTPTHVITHSLSFLSQYTDHTTHYLLCKIPRSPHSQHSITRLANRLHPQLTRKTLLRSHSRKPYPPPFHSPEAPSKTTTSAHTENPRFRFNRLTLHHLQQSINPSITGHKSPSSFIFLNLPPPSNPFFSAVQILLPPSHQLHETLSHSTNLDFHLHDLQTLHPLSQPPLPISTTNLTAAVYTKSPKSLTFNHLHQTPKSILVRIGSGSAVSALNSATTTHFCSTKVYEIRETRDKGEMDSQESGYTREG